MTNPVVMWHLAMAQARVAMARGDRRYIDAVIEGITRLLKEVCEWN